MCMSGLPNQTVHLETEMWLLQVYASPDGRTAVWRWLCAQGASFFRMTESSTFPWALELNQIPQHVIPLDGTGIQMKSAPN